MNFPVNTYRIQFNKKFTFQNLKERIPYLRYLGVDCIYASPIFKAVHGSNHGYDITDPHTINPEIGTHSQLRSLKEELRQNNIKWIQDIVPNHMAFHPSNFWLMDVLEKKKESGYYNFFDINWHHPFYKGKLMAPFLGETLDDAIANDKIKLTLEDEGIHINYYDHNFPASITSYKFILDAANTYKKRVLSIINRDEEIQDNLDRFCENKKLLHEFLEQQNFQLVHWRETNKTINYRRFFTINGLICLKMEDESVFNHYHKFIYSLIKEEIIDGLRIDHIDGLLDPTTYLKRLRTALGKNIPVYVEKILEPDETLPEQWQSSGTTGYDFLSHVNRLLTQSCGIHALKECYNKIFPTKDTLVDIIIRNKLNFLETYMGGELNNLHMMLKEINPEIKIDALALMLAGMPVYRIYPTEKGLTEYDKNILKVAAGNAQQFKPDTDIENLLLFLCNGEGEQWLFFMQRFQQLSGPLAAKGIEDTTFYQYNLLISHNEVGDNPDLENYSKKSFTKYINLKKRPHPHALNATSTHDTKRGEDARMRINVLSEIPGKWDELVKKLNIQTSKYKINQKPDVNDEYFLYQTLIGSLPAGLIIEPDYSDRLKEYMIKVVRESKVNSNWNSPNEDYEKHLSSFVYSILRDEMFLEELKDFQHQVTLYGALKSISQTVLKFTLPGLSDTYQGSELWNFSFVDPDNRLPVDYDLRNSLLNKIKDATINDIESLFKNNPNTAEVKLFFTHRLMQARMKNKDLFLDGDFEEIIDDPKNETIYSFKRRLDNKEIVVVCGINCMNSFKDKKIKVKSQGKYQNLFSRETIEINDDLYLSNLFSEIPVAVLIKV